MEAEWRAALHARQHLGELPRITLERAIHFFCESKSGTPNHRPLLSQARIVLAQFPGTMHLHDFSQRDFESFRQRRLSEGRSPQTVKHGLALIGGCIKHARRLGYRTPELQMPEIKLPKWPLRYLSQQEEERLLAALDPTRTGKGLAPIGERSPQLLAQMQDAYDLVVLLLDTGARYSEIANIPWSRIDLGQRAINLWRSKVQNETVLFMTDRVFDTLERRKREAIGPYLFANKAGRARGYSSLAIRKALKRAGLNGCRIHTLRHTHASRLVQNGLSVYEVKEILGHSDIRTTMRYAHLESRTVAAKARDTINRLSKA